MMAPEQLRIFPSSRQIAASRRGASRSHRQAASSRTRTSGWTSAPRRRARACLSHRAMRSSRDTVSPNSGLQAVWHNMAIKKMHLPIDGMHFGPI